MKELDRVLDKNEKVFWEGKPKFSVSIFGNLIILLIVLIILIVPIFTLNIELSMSSKIKISLAIFSLILILFIYIVFDYKNTYYAITNKRIIIQSGIIGRDFETIDFDQITNAEVNIGVMDKIFGSGRSGSIMISTAGSIAYSKSGAYNVPFKLNNILNPYEAFRFFKTISHAVKTDIQFPNKYRPSQNPGYNSKYNIDK
jgi:uncharacterized membrane protein YdbT with pleckstrin-like domain